MAEHNTTGKLGEDIATEYLQNKGYEIIERNWRPKKSRLEVDIIAKNETNIAIVEVKTRKSTQWGEPEEFINWKKIKFITDAAQIYVCTHEIGNLEPRFDTISIVMNKENKVEKIEHIEGAWIPKPKYY